MKLRWKALVLAVFAAQGNLLCAQEPSLPPVVGDLSLVSNFFGGTVSGQVPSEGNSEVWSDLQLVAYVPGYGTPPGHSLRLLIPPSFDPVTQIFEWDTAGSSPGDYAWGIEASNSAGSDSGTISVANVVFPDYPVPIVEDLKFTVQSPLSVGGIVQGKVTATEEPVEWSELLYPTFKSQPNGPTTPTTGIQTPSWNADTQQFSWNMLGAQVGIYTWIVKARNENGHGAGAIEVHILVPEPTSISLITVTLLGSTSFMRRLRMATSATAIC